MSYLEIIFLRSLGSQYFVIWQNETLTDVCMCLPKRCVFSLQRCILKMDHHCRIFCSCISIFKTETSLVFVLDFSSQSFHILKTLKSNYVSTKRR